ncbi:MAG: SEC-C metal-binding domain-containing protein [Bacillota bacterium]|nr:SEC-C metal-binding domain-containing protein [Bacillota bacterium]
MKLYDQWNHLLNDGQQDSKFWNAYLAMETTFYENLLALPVTGDGFEKRIAFETSVKELAEKHKIDAKLATGFVDGINDSLAEAIDLESLEADTEIRTQVVLSKLFQNMIKAKAEWLYTLDQWAPIFSEEERKQLRREYIDSVTAKSEKIAGRNDPCPCGSGKKYKKCCLNKETQ